MDFEFKAVSKDGQKTSGLRSAANKMSLARDLRREGYFLVWAQPQNLPQPGQNIGEFVFHRLAVFGGLLFNRVSLQEKMIFARHLALMMRAGFSLNKALETLTRQTKNKYFAKVLQELSAGVSAGQTFTQVVSSRRDVFSPIFISMVKVGEASGKLEGTLGLAALYLKREHSLKNKIKGAMVYPVVIVCALIAVGAIMVIFVLPQLASTFSELNITLPLTTRIVFEVANFSSRFWYLALMIVLIFSYALYFFIRKTEPGRNFVNLIFLKLPIFSDLTKKLNSARFSRTMASLLSSGVPLTEALSITSDSLTNVYYKRVLASTLKQVETGKSLSSLLSQSPNLFPPVVTEMMAVGEETGSLTTILVELARFFEGEVAVATKGISSIIEPVIMIVVGIAVGIFALSIIQPIYSITSGL